jgi:hypothetical protein
VPIDPTSISPGKRYATLTGHLRTVLEVTNDRVRFAYGGSESGGVGQWRWQDKSKFAQDAAKEIPIEAGSTPNGDSSTLKTTKQTTTRKTLTKRE